MKTIKRRVNRARTPSEILETASPAQIRWVNARLTSKSDAEACRAIGYNTSTVLKWSNKDDLDEVVRLYLLDTVDAARLILRSSASRAAEVLFDSLKDYRHRVEAAKTILDRTGLPAAQKQEYSGGIDVRVAEELSDDELAIIAARGREEASESETGED